MQLQRQAAAAEPTHCHTPSSCLRRCRAGMRLQPGRSGGCTRCRQPDCSGHASALHCRALPAMQQRHAAVPACQAACWGRVGGVLGAAPAHAGWGSAVAAVLLWAAHAAPLAVGIDSHAAAHPAERLACKWAQPWRFSWAAAESSFHKALRGSQVGPHHPAAPGSPLIHHRSSARSWLLCSTASSLIPAHIQGRSRGPCHRNAHSDRRNLQSRCRRRTPHWRQDQRLHDTPAAAEAAEAGLLRMCQVYKAPWQPGWGSTGPTAAGVLLSQRRAVPRSGSCQPCTSCSGSRQGLRTRLPPHMRQRGRPLQRTTLAGYMFQGSQQNGWLAGQPYEVGWPARLPGACAPFRLQLLLSLRRRQPTSPLAVAAAAGRCPPP